jgi:hypothetical protein
MTLFPAQYCPSSMAQIYVNTTSDPVMIDKFIARNSDVSVQTLAVYLVSSGDSPGNQNLFVNESITPAGNTQCLPLVGSELGPGDSIYVQATAANTIAIHANGRQRKS